MLEMDSHGQLAGRGVVRGGGPPEDDFVIADVVLDRRPKAAKWGGQQVKRESVYHGSGFHSCS